MNREILFRGKTYNGEWVYGYCYKVQSLLSSDFKWYIRNDYQKDNMVIPETIGQYIGRTDKNNNKIFEHDLINYNEEKYEVIYIDSKFWIMQRTENGSSYYGDFNASDDQAVDVYFEESEITGTIYDIDVEK